MEIESEKIVVRNKSVLAKWLAGKYGVSAAKKAYVTALAQEALDDAEMSESEHGFQFMPDPQWRR